LGREVKRLLIVFAALLPLNAYAELRAPVIMGKSNASVVVAPFLADIVRAVPPQAGSGGGSSTLPGGSDTQCQFNDAGAFGGDSGCTFNKTTDTLTVTNLGATSLTGTNVLTGRNTFGSAADAANAIDLGLVAGQICAEGSTADGVEICVAFADPSAADDVWTIPDKTGNAHTFAQLESAQTFTGQVTTSGNALLAAGGITINSGGAANSELASNTRLDIGTGGVGSIAARTENTPDTPQLQTNTSGAWSLRALANASADQNNGACGTAACTDPSLVIHAVANNTTNYNTVASYGMAGKRVKALTSATPVEVLRIPIAAEAGTSGMFYYTVYATDGATPQTRTGRVMFNGNNDGGTEVCVLGTPEELDNTPTGTLTAAITCDGAAAANAISIYISADSSLTETTLEAYGQVLLVGPGQPLPQ
jgi:hypothetical protein